MSHNPKTIPERLDAAQSGEEFGAVLNDLFDALRPREDDE